MKTKSVLLASASMMLIFLFSSEGIVNADDMQSSQEDKNYQTFVVPNVNTANNLDVGLQDQKWGTGLIKDAIKYILKHPKASAKVVEEFGGKKAAKAFLKHFSKVEKSLKPLLKYSDLVDDSVYHAVYRALKDAHVSTSVATSAAEAVKVALSIFF